jgi:hypothetical protein
MRIHLLPRDIANIVCKFTEAFWKLNTITPGETYSQTFDIVIAKNGETDTYLHLDIKSKVMLTETGGSRRGRVKVDACLVELASAAGLLLGWEFDEFAQMFKDTKTIYKTGIMCAFGQGQFINESVAREAEWFVEKLDAFINVELFELSNKADTIGTEEIAK